MATKVNFPTPLMRGDTRTTRVIITTAGVIPINITGDTLWLTIKATAADTDVQALIQIEALMPANADSVAGIGYITIPSDIWPALAPNLAGSYVYDIQWVRPGAPPVVTTILYGKVKIIDDVTDAIA